MERAAFWIRWSLRDLRRRWVVVVAIALIIGIGTGTYAGLSSISEWRRSSNDASYEALEFHDLQIGLTTGSAVPMGALADVIRRIPSSDRVVALEERLVAPTQVDAQGGGRTILTPGRIVGVDLAAGSTVDRVFAASGRILTADDAEEAVVVVDAAYARHNRLAVPGTMTLPGGVRARVVGAGSSPEYFYLTSAVTGTVGAQTSFAVVYAPIALAQRIAGLSGQVNDAALRLAPGTDPADVRREIESRLTRDLPGVGATVAARRDNDSYRVLYDDIGSDQEIYNIFALILLGAGTFAAFNLASRIVEAQRRELGVGMAMGVPPPQLAVRPLLLGLQIAVLGIIVGVPLGAWLGESLLSVFRQALPMPAWQSPFQADVYARGAALGLALPMLAVAIPTLRAVRMPPVRAVEAGFRAARGAGVARLARDIPLPGGTLARMPLRNLLRAPRRTLLTVLGIAAAVVTAVGVTGMVDSFLRTLNIASGSLVGPNQDRIAVSLRGFVPVDSTGVDRGTSGQIAVAESALRVPARISVPGKPSIDIVLELQDAGSRVFVPPIEWGSFGRGAAGIVLTRKAADDLGIGLGDDLSVEHPYRTGPAEVATRVSRVNVAGLVDNPLRIYAYMDRSQLALLNLAGAANLVNVVAVAGTDLDALKRALLGLPQVASAERVAASSEALEDLINQYTDVLRIIEVVALALALLIAFNSATIAADERAREYATLFAFGVPLRTVIRNAMTEGAVAGTLATLLGIGGGVLVVGYIVNVTTPRVLPDLAAVVAISPATIATGALVGVVASTVAPLLTLRKLARMNVPATLRVVE